MVEKSRVRFNPATKEMEVEGSESFVKTTLDKLLAMISEAPAKKAVIKTEPNPAKAAPVKAEKKKAKAVKAASAASTKADKMKPKAAKATPKKKTKKIRRPKSASKMATGTKRGELSKAVLDLIHGSPEGIAMAELKEKTGMKDIQIRNIVTRATKLGKIRKMNRGVYGRVAAPEASPVETTG